MGENFSKKAYELFETHSKKNIGTWIERSQNVAEVAKRIAGQIGLDEDKAYTLGLLYDIGRVYGNTGVRHTIDGYNFLKEQGYEEEIARICITHAFITKDVKNTIGEADYTDDEYNFLEEYLAGVEYDTYDKLIQLADSMAIPTGIVLLETRIIDVCLRYGMDEDACNNVKGIFKIKEELEEKLGYSIYKLFPEIAENIGK